MSDALPPSSDAERRLLEAINNLPEDTADDDPLEAREAEILENYREGPDEGLVDIRVSHRHRVPVIHVEGELDLFTADRFRDCLRAELTRTSGTVIVDLSGTSYIDSTGLGILLQGARRASTRLVIVSPRERITRLFRIAGLAGNMTLFASLPDAIAGLDQE